MEDYHTDEYSPILSLIRETNATFLRDLLQELDNDTLTSFYSHFGGSTIDDLVAFLHGNQTQVNEEAGRGDGELAAPLLMLVLPPIIILVGSLGNVLTFLILITDRTMRTVSTYFYLAVLALADTFVLYMGLLTRWISFLIGQDVKVRSAWFCKVSNALGLTVSDFSVWLLVAVTCERFVVVCFPLQASAICRRSAARQVVVVLLLVLATINFHLFWSADVTTHGTDVTTGRPRLLCGGTPGFEFLVEQAWPWVDAVLYSLLPFIVIASLNAVIIAQVMKAKQQRQKMCNNAHNGASGKVSEKPASREGGAELNTNINMGSKVGSVLKINGTTTTATTVVTSVSPRSRSVTSSRSAEGDSMRLTVMLLAVTFSFLITTLPITVVSVTGMVLHSLQDDRQLAVFDLTRRICELLMYVNHSVNFFLYCATGHKFRRQLFVLLSCRSSRSSYSVSRHDRGTSYVAVNTNGMTPPSNVGTPGRRVSAAAAAATTSRTHVITTSQFKNDVQLPMLDHGDKVSGSDDELL